MREDEARVCEARSRPTGWSGHPVIRSSMIGWARRSGSSAFARRFSFRAVRIGVLFLDGRHGD